MGSKAKLLPWCGRKLGRLGGPGAEPLVAAPNLAGQVDLWSVAVTRETSAANVHTVVTSGLVHRMSQRLPHPPPSPAGRGS